MEQTPVRENAGLLNSESSSAFLPTTVGGAVTCNYEGAIYDLCVEEQLHFLGSSEPARARAARASVG